MGNLSGQDIVDVMVHGVNTHVKQHIRDRLIEQEVALFKKRITTEIDSLLSEMVFDANNIREASAFNRQDLHLLIEWSKGQKEYKTKYEVVSSVEE